MTFKQTKPNMCEAHILPANNKYLIYQSLTLFLYKQNKKIDKQEGHDGPGIAHLIFFFSI